MSQYLDNRIAQLNNQARVVDKNAQDEAKTRIDAAAQESQLAAQVAAKWKADQAVLADIADRYSRFSEKPFGEFAFTVGGPLDAQGLGAGKFEIPIFGFAGAVVFDIRRTGEANVSYTEIKPNVQISQLVEKYPILSATENTYVDIVMNYADALIASFK